MKAIENIRVLEVRKAQVIHNTKGKEAQIRHRKNFALSFCMEGRITYTHNGKEYVSDPQHAVFLPKGQSYLMHTDKAGSFPLIDFACAGLSGEKFLVVPLKDPGACLYLFQRLQEQQLLGRSQLKQLHTFYELLELLLGNTAEDGAQLSGAMQYLETHLSDPTLSNRVLAQQVGFSEVYFRRLFTQCYGISPKQYILELRIRKAKQLLTDGRQSITAVSEQCGFSGVYHFSRFFKERTGLSPTDFARQNRVYKI